jgi:aminoglycoside phosphotransferase (APT) family kinase protein
MESVVREIVGRTLPDATVTRIRQTRTGNFKQTVLVECANRESVVVQYRNVEHGSLRPEAHVTEVIAEETTVPVPHILDVGQLRQHSYIVTRRVPGVNLHERFESLPREHRLQLSETLGCFLGILHRRFTFDSYGSVVASNGGLRTTGTAGSWREWLEEYLVEGLREMREPLDDLRDRIVASVRRDLELVPEDPIPRFYPWDYRPGNVLLQQESDAAEGIAAVLDWGDPLAADRELSVAKAEFLTADWYADADLAEDLRGAFYNGYEGEMPLPDAYWESRRRVYRLVAVVRSSFDSKGDITRPRYPMVEERQAAAFHRRHLETVLEG